MSDRRTLEQRRAERALQRIEQRTHLPPKHKEAYVSYAKALPAEILMNGLGQAMAMLLAAARGKADDPHRLLHDDMQAWLCGNEELPALPYEGDLVPALMAHGQEAYLLAQGEAVAYCGWLKRFAVAYLENPDASGGEE
jgi:CRISPR-associated protein Cmr5